MIFAQSLEEVHEAVLADDLLNIEVEALECKRFDGFVDQLLVPFFKAVEVGILFLSALCVGKRHNSSETYTLAQSI